MASSVFQGVSSDCQEQIDNAIQFCDVWVDDLYSSLASAGSENENITKELLKAGLDYDYYLESENLKHVLWRTNDRASVEIKRLYLACKRIGEIIGRTSAVYDGEDPELRYFNQEQIYEAQEWKLAIDAWDPKGLLGLDIQKSAELRLTQVRTLTGEFALLRIMETFADTIAPTLKTENTSLALLLPCIRRSMIYLCTQLKGLRKACGFDQIYEDYICDAVDSHPDFIKWRSNRPLVSVQTPTNLPSHGPVRRKRYVIPQARTSGQLRTTGDSSTSVPDNKMIAPLKFWHDWCRFSTLASSLRPTGKAAPGKRGMRPAGSTRSRPLLKTSRKLRDQLMLHKPNVDMTISLAAWLLSLASAFFLFWAVFGTKSSMPAGSVPRYDIFIAISQVMQFAFSAGCLLADWAKQNHSSGPRSIPGYSFWFWVLFIASCLCGLMSPIATIFSNPASSALMYFAGLGQMYATLTFFKRSRPVGPRVDALGDPERLIQIQ